ncbi:MAG: LysR family transcriptional regulator [Syntrophaceae bacterium]|nr:LysR family transcriptional regulator [Syntrophaceae bacterium]
MIDEITGDFIQWLRSFYFVADKESVTQAARMMRRGQPTITYQLKRLETELGVTLFDRSSGKMKLTQEGSAVLEKAISLFEMVRAIRNTSGGNPLEYKGRIVIVASHAVVDSFLPPYIVKFSNDYPNVTFHVVGGVMEMILEKVELSEADLGIASIDSVPDAIDSYDLFETEVKLIVPKNKRFFGGSDPTLEQVAQCPLILFSHTGAAEPFIERRFADHRLNLRVVASLNNFVSVKKYVAQGLGVAIISEFAISEEDKAFFNVLPLHFFPKRKYALLARKKKYFPPAVHTFISSIKQGIEIKK